MTADTSLHWETGSTDTLLDPLSDWIVELDPLKRACLADRLRPAFVEGSFESAEALAQAIRNAATGGATPRVIVPSFSPAGSPGDSVVLVVDRPALEILANGGTSGALAQVRSVTAGSALPKGAVGGPVASEPVASAERRKAPVVVTAVIDTGLPLLNARFRTLPGEGGPGQSRVAYAWVQDADQAQSPVPYGREYVAGELDEAIATFTTPGAGLDEIAAYRALGLMAFKPKEPPKLARRSTHGAHVAALAGGFPPEDQRTDRPLIFVDLARDVTEDTSGAGLEGAFADAIDYVFDRADRLSGGGPCALVINFSYGGTGGPLDGSTSLERRLDTLIRQRRDRGHPTSLLLPSGNARLADGHARIRRARFEEKPEQEIFWRLQPSDATFSAIEIWTPKLSSGGVFEVALAYPGQTEAPTWLTQAPSQVVDLVAGEALVARLRYDEIGAPTDRGRFTLITQCTGRADGEARKMAPAGMWRLKIRGSGLANGDHLDAWVLRDEELPGFDTDARQSRLIDPNCPYRPLLEPGRLVPDDGDGEGPCLIRRSAVQNSIASGAEPVVVAGYVDRSGLAARYSAGGPLPAPGRPDGPDAMAVSDASRVHQGVISSGVLSGSTQPLNGTSVAVPQLTRRLADRAADNEGIERDHVHRMARASERSGVFEGRADQPPPQRSGEGRIQLEPQTDRRYRPLGPY